MKNDPLITDINYYSTKENIKKSQEAYAMQLFSNHDFEQFIPVPPENGTGGFRIISILDELGIIITDHLAGDSPVLARADAISKNFKFTFNLSSKPVSYKVERGRVEYIASPLNTYILSPNAVLNFTIPPYNHQKWISVVIGPKLLRDIIESLRDRLPKAFSSFMEEPGKDFFIHETRYTPRIKLVLEQVLNCFYSGNLKRIYLEGKAIELIALRLGFLLNETGKGYHSVVLSNTDVEKLHYIETIIKSRIADPPTIIELSGLVGLSITKLKCGFKSLFGVSVGSYIRDLRMEQARDLLENGNLNVSEAAYAVGYKSLSHFSLAFKARYGYSPRNCVKITNHFGR